MTVYAIVYTSVKSPEGLFADGYISLLFRVVVMYSEKLYLVRHLTFSSFDDNIF